MTPFPKHGPRARRLLLFAALALAGPASAQQAPTPFRLTTEDGIEVAALHYAPTEAGRRPAVILLHGGGQQKEIWERTGILATMNPDRYHFVALDIRGHGESDPRPRTVNPGLALNDVEAVMDWLAARDDVDPERIALVGASYGANISYAGLLTRDWPVVGMVALSATMAGFAWFPAEDYTRQIPKALFLHGSDEPERYRTHEAMDRLTAATAGDFYTGTVKGRTHAQGLYNFDEVPGLVRSWLESVLER